MIDKTYNLMAGEVYVYIESKNKQLENEILEFTYQTLINLISIFNFYDKNSLLFKLNTNKEVQYNNELAYVLKTSLNLYELTKGNFNIFLGNEITKRKQNLKSQEKTSNKKIGIDKMLKITKDKIILNKKNIAIDLGGIAKGYIVDRAIEIAKEKYANELRTILIDARGDIKIQGIGDFKIEIENPFNTQIPFCFITLKNASVVTSGHNMQIFKSGSHIIGKPTDIYTITLISNEISCHMLDALATYFILLSSEETLELLEFDENFKEIEALIILTNGKVLKTSFWDQYE